MNRYVIDTSVWIDYFSDPNEKLISLIEDNQIIISMIAIAELADKFVREDERFDSVLLYLKEKVKIVDITIDIALNAAKIKKRVRKTRSKFGLADAIHLATARSENAVFITKDNDFRDLDNVLLI